MKDIENVCLEVDELDFDNYSPISPDIVLTSSFKFKNFDHYVKVNAKEEFALDSDDINPTPFSTIYFNSDTESDIIAYSMNYQPDGTFENAFGKKNIKDFDNKTILDFGCGEGGFSDTQNSPAVQRHCGAIVALAVNLSKRAMSMFT